MEVIKLALHWQMFITLFLGIIVGWVLGGCFNIWDNFIYDIGIQFLHAINMIVIPLVFLSTLLVISTVNSFNVMGAYYSQKVVKN